MTIAQRLDDAEFLWLAGRREGAMLSALVAFAATARRALPDEKYDSVAFQRLFQEQLNSAWTITFRGKSTPLSLLFYKWLRCELVHQGTLPVELSFNDDDSGGLFDVALSGNYSISLSNVWYHSLVLAVLGHPANADIFPDQDAKVVALLEQHRLARQRVIGTVPRRKAGNPPPDC